MISIRGVSKHYGDQVVVDDLTLDIPAGKLTAIIGPNGAGKSTLLSMASRLLPMTSGSILVGGLDVATTPGPELARKLSVLRQDNQMTMRLTVRDLVGFGRFPYSRGNLGPADKPYIERAIDYLDLRPLQSRYLDELSGGQRQRAFVAMVLAQDTDYVLLDEPLNDLDLKHGVQMMGLLRRMVDELGRTVVAVLHDINFASVYADHIVVMKDGMAVREGPPDAIVQTASIRDIYEVGIDVQVFEGRRFVLYRR